MRSSRLAYLFLPVVSAALLACASGEAPGSTFQTSEGGFGGGGEGGEGGEGAGSTTIASSSSSSSSTASSATSSASSGSGGSASSSGTGAGGGGNCEELGVGEPNNDDESGAVPLQNMGSGADAKKISGTLAGPDDVDWYRYEGDDDIQGSVEPSVDFKAASFARICQFFECTGGDKKAEISCPSGTQATTSPGGRVGCCGGNSFHLNLNCAGTTEDSALVFIRVDNPKQSECVTYDVTYEY